MLQDVKDLTASGVIKGLNTQYNLLGLQKDQSPNMMDVKINYDGSFEKRLGSRIQNSVSITGGSSSTAGFSPTTASILTSFVSYWPLDEASGNRSDKYGSAVMQESGGVLYAGGIRNQAALFVESSSQFLRAASSQLFTANSAFSYSAWFYLNSTGGTARRTILSKRGSGTATTELVTNGNFETDASGWTAAGNTLSSVSGGQSGNCLQLSYNSGANYAYQAISTVVGATYNYSIWNKLGTTANTQIKIGTSPDDTTQFYSGILADANWTQYSGTFVASATTTYVTLNNLTSTAGKTALFDSVSVTGATATGVFEYSLSVGTDNIVTFDVSSSGTAVNGSVRATSFGAVDTSTWYNAICFYDSANAQIGIVVNESFPVITSYTAGIIAGSALLTLGAENTANFMDGRIDEVGFWTKRMGSDGIAVLYNKGSGNTYTSNVDATPWASFDFGASSIRWLTVAAGTGVYASSNLGLTWINIGTSQSATYQYLDRSKNVLIKTSDAYDSPLYWAGSAGTYLVEVGNSAPLCKYSINFQGFFILLNSSTQKRSFNYIDENFQLSSTAWLNFDLPSSADDEITSCFILRRYLYVSTRYKIYRVSYVGGNPDWQFIEIKSWGFIPRTVKKVVISNQQQGSNTSYSIGEVVIGLSYDRKLKIFDGSGDQILSNNIEKDNTICEFALDKIPYVGSGPILSFAELDPIPNVYRLCVAIGQDSRQTSHFINYDGRSQALYPYSNMNFNCMCVAESANRQFLIAFDRNGFCHMMDSGNLDGGTTVINDFYESPFMFDKTPSQSSKGHKTDLFFSNTSSGKVYYYDNIDYANSFKERKNFVISGSAQKLIHYESVDVPEMYNTYRFKISSSSGTNEPWRLQRYDHFTAGLGIGRNF